MEQRALFSPLQLSVADDQHSCDQGTRNDSGNTKWVCTESDQQHAKDGSHNQPKPCSPTQVSPTDQPADVNWNFRKKGEYHSIRRRRAAIEPFWSQARVRRRVICDVNLAASAGRQRSEEGDGLARSFEVLNRLFVLFCGGARFESAEVTSFPGFWVNFSRVKPILSRLELANHACLQDVAIRSLGTQELSPRGAF